MTKKTKTETQTDAKTDLAKKKEKLQAIKEMVQKKFGDETMLLMSDGAKKVPCIPTGSLLLDLALGSGGYPEGRIIEIYGPEASGKTTLTLHATAQVQKAGGTVAFIDAEHALDPNYAQAVGVDIPNLLISQPDDGEQALDIAEMLVDTGEVNLIVIDSVAALSPRAELEGEMGDHNMGLQARMMSKACRKLTAKAKKKNVTIMFINQLRMKIGVMFGNPETTTGGNALKFYASVRLDVRRLKAKSGDAEKEGIMKVKVVKNKVAPPFKICEIPVVFGKGIDQAGEVYQLAKEVLGIFRLGGGTHYYEGDKPIKLTKETAEKYMIEEINPGDKFASKRDDALAMIQTDKNFFKALRTQVESKLKEKLSEK